MSSKYKVRDQEEVYFVTITVIDWVDLLSRPEYKNIIISSLKYCSEYKGLNIHAFVIMSNHFHAILSSQQAPLESLIRDMKKYTSKELIRAVNEVAESRREWLLKKFAFAANRIKNGVDYKVWQDGFHPVALTNNKMIDERLNYIHDNPVVQGLVYEPEHYVYSSARDYAGRRGLLSLQLIE
tara:strand:- start:168 stop:713 length:546 start_codon:yes stop_codon:yes gene_type:complete